MNDRTTAFGPFIAATMILALSTAVGDADDKGALTTGTRGTSTSEADVYRRFAGRKAGEVLSDNDLKMEFVWCLPGSFAMGPIQVVNGKQVNENQAIEDLFRRLDELANVRRANPNQPDDPDKDDPKKNPDTADDRDPRRETRVFLFHGFWLGKYEVTRAAWQQIMETEPWAGRKIVLNGDDFPATYVSWNGAMEFCRKVTEQERKAGRLPGGWEYTLPTEAQWERACRAQTTTRYSFGDDAARLGDFAWYNSNTSGTGEPYPHRVGQKKPNRWGLYDMHGNVMEWYQDSFGTPPGGRHPVVTGGDTRVQRGGHFETSDSSCHSAGRTCEPPDLKKLGFGFRVALSYIE